jgi:hypothetical protein
MAIKLRYPANLIKMNKVGIDRSIIDAKALISYYCKNQCYFACGSHFLVVVLPEVTAGICSLYVHCLILSLHL